MYHKFIDFIKSRRGGVMVEFAAIAPIMLLLTFPVIDYSRYILIQQKLVKSASFMADAVAMSRPVEGTTTQQNIDTDGMYLTQPVLEGVVDTMPIHMMPFDAEQPGGPDLYQAIITSVYPSSAGVPLLGWQYDLNSHSFYDSARSESTVGLVASQGDIGTPAIMPPELQTLQAGENLIVAEVFAEYVPITPDMSAIGVNFLSARRLTYRAFFRARYGNLRCIWQVYMPPDCQS